MTRNLRALGRLLAAGAAIFVATASAAQAEGEFMAENYPTTVTTTSSEQWIFPGLKFKCTETHRQFELTKAASLVQTATTFAGCKGEPILEVSISMNECAFVLALENKLLVDLFNGSFDFVCPVGKQMVIKAATCEIKVETQLNRQETQYLNETEAAPKKRIRFELVTEKLKYNVTKDGIGCPLPKVGVAENGEIVTAAAPMTGKDGEGKAVGIWVE
jgi:hypothetical protein